MISQIALIAAVLFADGRADPPEFVEATIRDGVSEDDRRAVESIQKQRREAFERTAAEIEAIQSALPGVEKGTVERGVDPLKKPDADAAGNWHFATREAKAATLNAYHTRLRILKKRLANYAADPTFTIPFSGLPDPGTIGYLTQPLRVIHVATEIEILADAGPAGLLWIQGIDARQIADNQALALPPWAFYVEGPRCLIDGLGIRRIVLLLRRFDVGLFLE